MQTIPDKIGGQVRIIRGDMTGMLAEVLTAAPAVVLLAPSGSGKSVIARQFVEEISSVADWLWLEASSATLAPCEIKAELGLSYPLEEILRGTTSARCYLVVDGVDRLVSFEDFRRLAALIAALGPLEQSSPWRLVLVCQSEAWERVQRLLQKANFPIRSCNDLVIRPPSYEQLQPVWEAFPALRPLSLRRDLQQILWRPKILDLVAIASLRGEQPAVREWVGESSVINWFWQSEVEDAPEPLTRAGTLMELAETCKQTS